MTQGIAVIGDIVRPDGKGRVGGTDRSVLWLRNAIRHSVHAASGLPVDAITATTCPDLAAAIAAHRPARDAALHWAAVYTALPETHPAEAMLSARLRGRFCVGYELPPYLIGLLDRSGIPWIDIRIHPVRFMDDLLFAVRASTARTQAALALPPVAAVLTVNSSIAYEAGYFGKPVHCLAPLPFRVIWRGDRVEPDACASLDDRVLTPDFWRSILAPHMPVTPTDGIRLIPKPNRLRIAMDSFWNYQQIDTDRIPRRAM